MTSSELARKAAVEVRRGWCQHTLEDVAGNVCLEGAIRKARYGRARQGQSFSLPLLGEFGIWLGTSPSGWNDSPGQTAENVAWHLEAFAEYLDGCAPAITRDELYARTHEHDLEAKQAAPEPELALA